MHAMIRRWSEDRLHRWLATTMRPRGLAGSRGHDAAVLTRNVGRDVVCVDQCVEGVHFERGARPEKIGAKAAARALSDLAATAATPRALLLALDAPRTRDEAWMKRVISAVRARGLEFGADLVGGDLCASTGPARLTVTAIGDYAGSGRPPGRDRARAGQRVVLTGPVGGSILGRHLAIEPRIEAGIALHAAGATALMDVSDGLAFDLFRLARAAGMRIELDLASVPIHRDAARLARTTARTPLDHALHDGEDHELIATLGRADCARAVRRIAHLHDIGRVVRGSGLWLVDATGSMRRWSPKMGGFSHGS